uniref:Uncharacterized protein n=1 Tax=Lotharella oceanica TaxID=641309 RepID=A0A7S2TZG3_9EUKA|mmetsp:Transcript_34221/g.63451  ORF Transcript_34221/g.63451 Transcript_34221/m.63451 type:complete len:485 (+) Transcript_34221:34-1488(+)
MAYIYAKKHAIKWPKASAKMKGCVVLIDNSNLFICGKAVAGKKRGFPGEDDRYRISINKLVGEVLHGRQSACGRLFGSGENMDDFSIQVSHTIEVEISERSTWSGKENIVDHKFVSKMSQDLGQLQVYESEKFPEKDNREAYCLITGDGGYADVVEDALLIGQVVEIWFWKDYRSMKYDKLRNKYPNNLVLYDLDDIYEEISFTKFTLEQLKKDRVFVVMFKESPSLEQRTEALNKLDKTMGVSYREISANGHDAMLIQCRNRLKLSTFEEIIKKQRINFKGVASIKSYPEFKAERKMFAHGSADNMLVTRNPFAALRRSQLVDLDEWEDAPSLNKKMSKLDRQIYKKLLRAKAARKRCGYREFCSIGNKHIGGSKPHGWHTREEENLFANQRSSKASPWKLRKYKKCINKNHTKGSAKAENCPFLHDWEDYLCLKCLRLTKKEPSLREDGYCDTKCHEISDTRPLIKDIPGKLAELKKYVARK